PEWLELHVWRALALFAEDQRRVRVGRWRLESNKRSALHLRAPAPAPAPAPAIGPADREALVAQVIERWDACISSRLPRVPFMAMLPLGLPWIDLVVGSPGRPELSQLRAGPGLTPVISPRHVAETVLDPSSDKDEEEDADQQGGSAAAI
ncbi:MAG: hypothetical protein ACOC0P_03540, partial [Planctomycetota bacterium]